MRDGFVKIAAASPDLRPADPAFNADGIIKLARRAYDDGATIILFPELSIPGYTSADLFFQKTLQRASDSALDSILAATSSMDALVVVGYPYIKDGKLYNTAVAMHKGRVMAIIPKKNIPMYGEFYEGRWFAPAPERNENVIFRGEMVPFGRFTILRFAHPSTLLVGCEICEDLWVPDSPSIGLAGAGATVILNPSASDEIIGKEEYRRSLVAMQSAKLAAGYVYADASYGESTTDMVFTGSNMIAENGTVLASSSFSSGTYIISEIDTDRLSYERTRMNTFPLSASGYEFVDIDNGERECVLTRNIPMHPFVPADGKERDERCRKILTLQAIGLMRRFEASHSAKAVIGLSGGLDSTLALLVASRAFSMMGRSQEDIIAVTMPCFGTTKRTRSNAELLARALGTSFMEIDIKESVLSHFRDIGHSEDDHSVTYENAQARERTQVLMDIANKNGGMVIGTGDLSELALGWATYNGDHMSMYGVNASIPKTLVRYLVRYAADTASDGSSAVLYDILDTPVSPELLPAKDGVISQRTEDIVGPYELHDFFLYYLVRFGFAPGKIFRLASVAFKDVYGRDVIKKWLVIFIRRFFAQQFKRSCLPDGPKVGTVTLSPRSDWRMPSDASASAWIEEAEALQI